MKQFALFIIAFWPIITFWCISRYGIAKGSIFALLGAYLLLPVDIGFDIPSFPDIDKNTVTPITIFIYCLVNGKKLGINSLPKFHKLMLAILILTPLITAINNNDYYAGIRGLSMYDGLSTAILSFLSFFPFLIGATYIRDETQHIEFMKYIAIASFIYCFLALLEVRLSPQLHSDVYGYFPHSWRQQIREGGFRPVIFLGHGLLVAMFIALGLACWAVFSRLKYRLFAVPTGLVIIFVVITLTLTKTYSAFIYGLFLYFVIKYLKPKQTFFIAFLFSVIFLSYPLAKTLNLFPQNQLVEFAASFSKERAQSLEFRFENEDILLVHANDKPFFGWGGWGRNRVFDNETGEDLTVTDGYWVIVFGTHGWFGFVSTFFFFLVPIWAVYRNRKQLNFSKNSAVLIPAHTIILAVLLIDQLPNSSLGNSGFYWLFAGALYGRVYELIRETKIKTNESSTFEGKQ